MGDLASHAVAYASLGLEIFPVHHGSKRPMAAEVKGAPSQYDATTDLDAIEQWWERWPDALIGHRLAEDVIVLDVDPRHNGHKTWAALKREIDMPRTRAHLSGRGDGGGHVWWRRPAGKLTVTKLDAWAKARGLGIDRDGRWTSGIDILRREHRYTILPPSRHPDTGRPYRWARGRGLNLEPAEMPFELVDLLVREEASAPTRQGPIWQQADSIADWYSANYSWADVLEPAGWSCVGGDGDSDGSEWRHPTATSAVSATVRHGCLFVYSTNTPFRPTEPDDPHGYTRFAAYAVLYHGGDQKAAGRAARALKDGDFRGPRATVNGPETPSEGDRSSESPSEPPGGPERVPQKVELEHLENFWLQSPELTRIRDFARARMCSPWGMLGVVLARVAAATPPFVVLPPLVGSYLSLNFYVVLVGGSGGGKDASISAGADAFRPAGGIEFQQIGLGSGEGILDQYVAYVPPDKQSGEPAHFEQHTTSVLFVNPEIETVTALKGRSNSTLMPMLRDAWMGSKLGFAYRNTEKRATLGAHKYRLCLIVGSQPTSADALLGEQAVGTPQRFVWLPVHDPLAPDDLPLEPEMPEWRLPSWPVAQDGKVTLPLCDEAVEAVISARRARLRGEESDDTPDGHALACREKVAALLALLHGETEVSLPFWSMAGIVQTVSDRTRGMAAAAIEWEQRRANRARALAAGERMVITTEITEQAEEEAIQRVCRLLASKLGNDWVSESKLKNALPGRDRKRFDAAVERLEASGAIEVEEYQYGTKTRRKLRSSVKEVA